MNINKIKKIIYQNLSLIIPLLLLVPIYFILYKIYIPRINAFGCFDDCFNFMGGYFLLQDKQIFSDFFYNHQPFAAYISAFVQAITHPQNIFELVLRHRQFVFIFSFIFNVFLLWRFRIPAFFFILIYETSKFYLFGDRFLAEGIIIYPLAYIVGVVFFKLSNTKTLNLDYFLIPIFTWFIIYMREPYVPLAIILFAIFLFTKKIQRIQIISLCIFLLLTIATFVSFNIPEFFFNVVTINYEAILPADVKANMFGNRYIQALLYPIYIIFYGPWNLLHQLLLLIDLVFLTNLLVTIKRKQYYLVASIVIILALANIRVVLPGNTFYGAFHMLVWFGLFIFITCLLVFSNIKNKAFFYVSLLIVTGSLLTFISSKSYFPNDSFDEHTEHITNYGEYIQIGEVVKSLSQPGDTLFIDGSDDLIYWQAKLPSPYEYSWYTSAMPHFKKYLDARITMFKKNPPTFYKEFGTCPKKTPTEETYRLPNFIQDEYIRLNTGNETESCLFVRKDKINKISKSQWEKASKFLYNLPSNENN